MMLIKVIENLEQHLQTFRKVTVHADSKGGTHGADPRELAEATH
jgi:hypothetical protein